MWKSLLVGLKIISIAVIIFLCILAGVYGYFDLTIYLLIHHPWLGIASLLTALALIVGLIAIAIGDFVSK